MPFPERLEDWKTLFSLLYFTIEGILHMNQKQVIMVGIHLHINLSAGGFCFHTCLDGIFQQIGKYKAQINLIYGKISGQGNQSMKRNIFSFWQVWNNIRKHCQQPDFHRNGGYSQRFFSVVADRYFLIFSMSPCSAREDSWTK